MIYFTTPVVAARPALRAGRLGVIATPKQGNLIPDYPIRCIDNGCYGQGWPGPDEYRTFLQQMAAIPGGVWHFAAAPDVVGDAEATLERSKPWLPVIADLGFPVAFVAQDGIEHIRVPWSQISVLFLGGTDSFKLGPSGRAAAAEALTRGKRVHMGRVSSLKRTRIARHMGCTSVDGRYIQFRWPELGTAEVEGWLRDVHNQPTLFDDLGDTA